MRNFVVTEGGASPGYTDYFKRLIYKTVELQ